MQAKVIVFGKCLVVLENGIAQRYAQAIRCGLWQCNITGEPWFEGAVHYNDKNEMTHCCGSNEGEEQCCDSRTDDDIVVEQIIE